MNLLDIFIIYLACGAPFGVYYFLKNRPQNKQRLWLKSLLHFLFWIPFALRLLSRINFRKYLNDTDKASAAGEQDKKLALLEKKIERNLLDGEAEISVYEFREIFERYVGLTLAKNTDDEKIADHEKEIFRLTSAENVELGAICLHRRNRKRLVFHQIAASEDFLYLVNQIRTTDSNDDELKISAISVTEFTKDFETRKNLEKMFARASQTDERGVVKKLEKDLWKPETHKLQAARSISRR